MCKWANVCSVCVYVRVRETKKHAELVQKRVSSSSPSIVCTQSVWEKKISIQSIERERESSCCVKRQSMRTGNNIYIYDRNQYYNIGELKQLYHFYDDKQPNNTHKEFTEEMKEKQANNSTTGTHTFNSNNSNSSSTSIFFVLHKIGIEFVQHLRISNMLTLCVGNIIRIMSFFHE